MFSIWQKITLGLHKLCTFTGGVILFGVVVYILTAISDYSALSVPDNTYLVVDFNRNFPEAENAGLWEEVTGEESLSFSQLLMTIEFAANDSRISGLVAKINNTSLEPAQVQDVARAVTLFKSSGKKTFAYSQGFGSLGQGNMEYYLASFFDKIYMQPHTYIGLTGINIEIPFFRNALNKIGVTPEFYARHEYKNAMAALTDSKISAAYREEMSSLARSLMEELELDISNNRSLKKPFMDIVNEAPLTADRGRKLNLIDGTFYASELEKMLKTEGAADFVNINDYAAALYPNEGNLPTIAVLNLFGEISEGKNEDDFGSSMTIGSQSVLEDIENIRKIKNLKAVILRINSPGGSYNAADEIYFALKSFKEETKIPVIVSQSAYAASGGYFISLAGDYIFAEPMTITGSIGVLGGKIVLRDLWQKLGVNWSQINQGQNAGILSVNKPFSPAEKKIFNASLDEVYQDFTAKVAANRKLSQPLDKVARGRIWTGRQAQKLGLVDELGGSTEAFLKALEIGKINKNQQIKILYYPKTKSFGEKLTDLLTNAGSVRAEKIMERSGVDITNFKLFKRLQYDTILLPFNINM